MNYRKDNIAPRFNSFRKEDRTDFLIDMTHYLRL